jgi:hypothetical protein
VRFRLRPGEDVGCLNLYALGDPASSACLIASLIEKRFRFAGSIGATEQTRDNPWLCSMRR